MNSTRKQQLQLWLGIVVSLICLGAIFLLIDVREVWHALRTANYGYLALTTVGIVVFLILRAIRWRFMLNNAVSFSQVFHIQNIGYMLTNLLPFRLGDVARGVLIGNVPPITVAQGISTMVMERILDMLFIVTLLPFAFASIPNLPEGAQRLQNAARIVGYLALVVIVLMIMAANMRPLAHRIATFIFDKIPFLKTATWVKIIDDLLAGLSNLTRLRDGFILIALSIITWLPIIFAYYTGMLAVGLEPSWAVAAVTVCGAALGIAAPSSPGQVGVYEAAVIFSMVLVGQPEDKATAFAFLYHAINFMTMNILGLIGLRGIGSTWQNVVQMARSFRRKEVSSEP